jgi:ribokinase
VPHPCHVIKAGADGAWCMVERTSRRVAGFPVHPVDSTGAGDSFDAAFLYAVLEKRAGMLQAVQIANAAGARACAFIGGTAARSMFEDLEGMMKAADLRHDDL